MKNYLALTLAFICINIFGQKADVDNIRFEYNYANLPDQYIEPENRRFFITTTGTNAQNVVNLPQTLRLYGWESVNDPKKSAIEIKFAVKGMDFGLSNNTNRKVETKDKDGKVTGTTIYYQVNVTNTGKSEITIYGPDNSYTEHLINMRKQEKAVINKKEQKKMQEEASNPFLSGVNKKVKETGGDLKLLAYNGDLNKSFFYATAEHITADKASKEYSDNAGRTARNHENEYLNELPAKIESFLNTRYGFTPIRSRIVFKKLDTESHPEYNMFKNATDAIKIIVAKTRYNMPVDDVAEDMQPIVDYFKKLENKLKRSSDKNDRRLRAAALFNIAQLYFVTDQHENAIITCNTMIEADLEKGDARDMIRRSEDTFKKLTFFNMKTRHIIPVSSLDKKDEVGNEVTEP